MSTTLVIMAAGLASRYGGAKQIEKVGPADEILMEYTIHDARKAGFSSGPICRRRNGGRGKTGSRNPLKSTLPVTQTGRRRKS